MQNLKEIYKQIKAFVFDVDGVLAKPTFFMHPGGEFMRSMHTKDGYALQYSVKKGFIVGIITGGRSETVRNRFKHLGITDVYLGSANKIEDFEDFMYKYGLKPDEILYMGDDIPDLEVMQKVGLPACPADAVPEIKQISKYISNIEGGNGCVRDIVEQIMKVQDKWLDADASHLYYLKNQKKDSDIS